MPACLQSSLLHRSSSVVIRDVCCRPDHADCGPEECSPTNDIVFPRAGVFVKKIAGEDIVADPNQVLFFRRGEPYRVAHPAGGDDCTVFAFPPDLLVEAVRGYQPRVQEQPDRPFEFAHTTSNPALYLFQQRLRQHSAADGQDALTLDEFALALLAAVVHGAYSQRSRRPERRRPATIRAHREQVERVRLLLAARFAQNLELAEIARAVHCSTFHLARLFRRETGLAIHQYRNRLRLRAALERIVGHETDLTTVALDLGFSSHSHFTDLFRRAFRLTPSECRRQASSRWLRELSKNLEAAKAEAA